MQRSGGPPSGGPDQVSLVLWKCIDSCTGLGGGVAGDTFSKDWEFVFRVLPAAVFLCLPDREKETSNQMHMKSLTSTFSGQRSKMKRDLPGDCVLKETLLKGKDGSRWCDVTLDSRSQKSMLCKGRNNNLMYTDGGVASGLLRELKHESGSMQILGDLETNQHICIFSPPSKRKCSALSIRGGDGTETLLDLERAQGKSLFHWEEAKPSSTVCSESQSAGNSISYHYHVDNKCGRAIPGCGPKGTEDIRDHRICDSATPSPLHVETDADCRYRDVRMLLDLLAPDPVCHASCSSPPLHHPSRSSIGGADEELALLFKYTHVMGGPASLEEIAQATS